MVGYSRMMARDEVATLGGPQASSVLQPAIARCGGRIVKLMGDGVLVEFGSVVDAVVSCSGYGSEPGVLGISLGSSREIEEAKRVWRELEVINPNYSLAGHLGRLPFKVPGCVNTIKEGLAKAGLIA